MNTKQSRISYLEAVIDALKNALDNAAYEAVSHQHPNCYDYSEYKKQYLKELYKKQYLKELADSYKIPSEYMPD